jgi:hypothetical protein
MQVPPLFATSVQGNAALLSNRLENWDGYSYVFLQRGYYTIASVQAREFSTQRIRSQAGNKVMDVLCPILFTDVESERTMLH